MSHLKSIRVKIPDKIGYFGYAEYWGCSRGPDGYVAEIKFIVDFELRSILWDAVRELVNSIGKGRGKMGGVKLIEEDGKQTYVLTCEFFLDSPIRTPSGYLRVLVRKLARKIYKVRRKRG